MYSKHFRESISQSLERKGFSLESWGWFDHDAWVHKLTGELVNRHPLNRNAPESTVKTYRL